MLGKDQTTDKTKEAKGSKRRDTVDSPSMDIIIIIIIISRHLDNDGNVALTNFI